MRRRVREAGRRTFRAISVRNYRLYFTGQVISVSGTWMQTVAQAYLILFPLHGTGVDVAIATSLQFLPLLLLGPFGGLIADRLDKRKVLYATQGTAGVLALVLGVLAATHSVTLWEVYVLAAGLGFVNLFDNPARQTFVSEMVGLELLPNAVSLNSVLMNSARVIGPAIGGVLILTVGVATCFFVNAVSYAAVIVALAMMRASELHPPARCGAGQGPGARGPPLRLGHARPQDPAHLHGGRRRLRLQLHRDAAAPGQVHLPRRRRPLQLVHGGHGRGGGARRPGHRLPQPAVHPAARLHRGRLRRRHPGGGARADAGVGPRPAGPHGRGEHLLRRHQQRHPAAAGRPDHAGPGDVAQRHRLPRQHADRRAAAGLHQRRHQPAAWPWPSAAWPRCWPASRSSCSAPASDGAGTEGLVHGATGAAPTNVVPLPVPLPVAEAGYERRELRTS